MRNQLRSLRGGKVSFFLFMDTITAVTAMLIMVSLMMTLYMGNRPLVTANASDSKSAPLEDTLAELDRITARNQSLRQLLATADTAPGGERLRADIANLQSLISSQLSNLDQLRERIVRQLETTQQTANRLGLGEEQEQIQDTKRQTETVRQTNQVFQAELDDVTRRITDLEAKIEKTKHDRSKLWLIPEADGSGKRPLLVSLSATQVVCERFNEPQRRKVFPAADSERLFAGLLRELRPDLDYFVFYIRPSGIAHFQRFSVLAKGAGFNVGYDAVEEDRQILFSQPAQEP
jgi:hypothetical protein